MLIGRRFGSDLKLVEESVSSSHAVVFEMDGHHYVRDLGSRTGTYVNRVKVHQQKLAGDDVIRIGETTLNYKASPEAVGLEAIEPLHVEAPESPKPSGGAAPEVPPKVPQKRASAADDDFGLDLLPFSDASAEPENLEPGGRADSGRIITQIFAENSAEVEARKNETAAASPARVGDLRPK